MEQTKDSGMIKGFKAVLILPALSVFIAVLLNLLYALPLNDSFMWFFGVFIYFFIPGNLLLRFLDFQKDEHTVNVLHSIALGTALMPLVYMVFRRVSHPELLYLYGLIMLLIWSGLAVREFKDRMRNVYTSFMDVLSVTVLISAVLLLLHFTHFTDVIFTEKGFSIRNIYLTENIFHLGIINNLKDMFPPLYPYASGVQFSHYHLNMHLEIEMFNRLFSIDTLKLVFFISRSFISVFWSLPLIFLSAGTGTRGSWVF